jgi:catechol 2,3-dioxygenase-like lactoylglutathione lyase family enzyme
MAYEQFRVGSLHHQCWRVRDLESVDAVHAFLVSIGAKIVHAPQVDAFAPGYYSVLFEDPDGIRLEVNHVPGRGLFDTRDQKVFGTLDER